MRSELDNPVRGTWRARGFRGRHPITAGRPRTPTGKGRACTAATQRPGPASTAPSPTNRRRTTAFVEGRMRRPGAFRASRRRPVEGGKRRRRPAEATDHFETRRKPKSRNARHRLIPIGKRVGRQRRSPFRTGPGRPIGSGAHSGSSPPTGEWARVRLLPWAAGACPCRARAALPNGLHAGRGTRIGNRSRMFAGIPARNLNRGLRIRIGARARGTTPKRAALRHFRGDGNPSSHPRPVHRTHHSTGRRIDPLHERLRRPGWGAPDIPLNTECRRLIDPRLRRFMQQSGIPFPVFFHRPISGTRIVGDLQPVPRNAANTYSTKCFSLPFPYLNSTWEGSINIRTVIHKIRHRTSRRPGRTRGGHPGS